MKNLHWASSCEVIEIVSPADAVEAGDKAASNEATRLADKAIVAAVSEPIKYAATNDTKETTSIAQTELTSASL
jgi:hypothetical protein